MSCSVEDHTFPEEARQTALDILESGKKTYHFQLFSGVSHGFALRGNMKNPYERMPALCTLTLSMQADIP